MELNIKKIKEAYKLVKLLRLPVTQEVLMFISKNPNCSNRQIEIYIARTFKYMNMPQTQITMLLIQLVKYGLVENQNQPALYNSWVITDKVFTLFKTIKIFAKTYKVDILNKENPTLHKEIIYKT